MTTRTRSPRRPENLSRMQPDPRLVARLARFGQESLLRWWGDLNGAERESLVAQIERIDFEEISELVDRFIKESQGPEPIPADLASVDAFRLPQTDGERVARRRIAEIGEQSLADGEVAVVVVAGGSGTRLGFEGPKGTFPIGPVSGASLFQIHFEKVVALGRRYGRPIPLYVMTSSENHEATERFLERHDRFGVSRVRLFRQGLMPAVDKQTGRVLLESKGRICLSPDGHGGTLTALAAKGPDDSPSCLEEMRELGIKTIFYFQVDNPLVKIADPAFLGLHRESQAEVSFKVSEKIDPEERVGVVVQGGGRSFVIEYSDLPAEMAEWREPDGRLRLWAANIAIHLFELSFVERLVSGSDRLPFHRAIKRVSHIDEEGRFVDPRIPNAVKFERFIFDALPAARRAVMVESDRAVEFEPLKNATGPDSPESVRRRMNELFAEWLEAAGAKLNREEDGPPPAIEISPLFALDANELRTKIAPGTNIDGPVYLR